VNLPAWIEATVATVTAAAALWLFIGRRLWRLVLGTTRFLEDWFGEPPRGGLAATPGIMARVAALETLVVTIASETQPDGGSSMRDIVHRIAADVADVKDEQARLRIQIELRQPPRKQEGPAA
jgi:hypothetical protein